MRARRIGISCLHSIRCCRRCFLLSCRPPAEILSAGSDGRTVKTFPNFRALAMSPGAESVNTRASGMEPVIDRMAARKRGYFALSPHMMRMGGIRCHPRGWSRLSANPQHKSAITPWRRLSACRADRRTDSRATRPKAAGHRRAIPCPRLGMVAGYKGHAARKPT